MTPVVMIVFNRADMTRRMLLSFLKAEGSTDRDVRIFMDGARNESDRVKCDAVERIILEFKDQLPRMQIVRRDQNWGCRANIIDAVTTVMREYGRAIVIEDDILISRSFLRYMDDALEFYKDDKRIWCVNGYRNLGVKVPRTYKNDIYLDRRNWSWGWGGWYDRWCRVDFDLKEWSSYMSDDRLVAKLDSCGMELRPMAEGVVRGGLNTWDIQCTVHVVLNDLYAIEPRVLLSKSIGFGGDSTHTSGANPILAAAKYYNWLPKLVKNIQPEERILRQLPRATCDLRLVPRIVRKLQRIYASFMPEQLDPVDMSEDFS